MGLGLSMITAENCVLEDGSLAVFAENMAHRGRDLTDRAIALDGFDDDGHQIRSATGSVFDVLECGGRLSGIAALTEGTEALDLSLFELGIDALNVGKSVSLDLEAVHADDDLLAAVHVLLEIVGGVLDLLLDVSALDGSDSTAEVVDALDVGISALLEFGGEGLDVVGTGERIYCLSGTALEGDDLLGAESDACGFFGRKCECFVEAIGVERLGSAENRGECLQRGADDVVFRLLRGESGSGGLSVKAQHLRARIGCVEAVAHDARPHATCSAELGDFFEEVVVSVEEEAEARGEDVHVEASADSGLHIRDA